MALPNLSLDDRTFEQLFGLLRKQIDTSQWLDHNYSDGGIALVDLLCWIGEMTLYRADRVPPAHVDKFANLILDPPEPATAALTLTATHSTEITVPAGARFATDFVPATSTRPVRRFVFETIAPLRFRPLVTAAPWVQTLTVTARELLVVENEALAISDGSPDQAFPLRPVHADLGLPADQPVPVLTDFVHRSATYDPNPRVTVGGVSWELKRFLMTEESYIDSAAPALRLHYMVDPDGRIRFGDGTFGSIPAPGSAIACTRYQVLQGPDALRPANTFVHQLDPVPGLTVTTIANGSVEGGDFFFTPQERIREGLKRFRRPYRLITASDFEEVLRVDFKEFQERAGAPERIVRAVALMNRRPAAPDVPAPGHVTLVLLATSGSDLDRELTDPGPFIPTRTAQQDRDYKQGLVDPAPTLVEKIQRFLDKRRLITTNVHFASPPQTVLPTLVFTTVTTVVVVDRERNTAEMTETIKGKLRAFLGIVGGGFDHKGWPLGGSVYRSKLFRLIEDIEGVDHVEALTLSPADALGDVVLGALSLPAIALDGLSVTVLRA